MTFTQSDAGGRFLLRATLSSVLLVRNYAVEQNITILCPVNELGVAEPLVQRQGSSYCCKPFRVQDTAS